MSGTATSNDQVDETNGLPTVEGGSEKVVVNASKALELARLVGQLKTTPRTGWVRRGVPHYESVADHSWRVACLAHLFLSKQPQQQQSSTANNNNQKIDVSRCVELSVLHDLGECIVGDITPHDKVSKEEKRQLENQAYEQLANMVDQTHNISSTSTTQTATKDSTTMSPGQVLMERFREYEDRTTLEGIAVKDLDLLDMIVQADEYEQRFDGLDLSEFFDSTPPSKFRTDVIRAIAHELHQQRRERRRANESKQQETGTNHNDSEPKHELSSKDKAFVDEYSKAYAALDRKSIEEIVVALRHWETK